jgi:hypothetical protein
MYTVKSNSEFITDIRNLDPLLANISVKSIEIDRENYKTVWKMATEEDWAKARWYNGMEIACGMKKILPDKTIVCGHVNTSFGHTHYEKKGSEFGPKADFSPFYAEGIIALDACTAFSGKMNCIVIDD